MAQASESPNEAAIARAKLAEMGAGKGPPRPPTAVSAPGELPDDFLEKVAAMMHERGYQGPIHVRRQTFTSSGTANTTADRTWSFQVEFDPTD